LEPLVEGIQKSKAQPFNPEDELFLLQLHHYIMAIGSVAKGTKLFFLTVYIFNTMI
jgi:exportin-T